jgi:DNA-binding MarR family transcriptional regulator
MQAAAGRPGSFSQLISSQSSLVLCRRRRHMASAPVDSRGLGVYTRCMTADPIDFAACRACACTAIRRASRTITHHYDEALRDSGLRTTQFTLLATLVQTGPMPMTPLAAFLSLERTTLTRNLKSLLRDGLVESRAQKDGRVRKIAITAKGEAKARGAFPLWKKAQESAGGVAATFNLPV